MFSLKSFAALSISLSMVATTALAAGAPLEQAINPNGNTAKCLDVRGAIFADGTPVQIYDCNGTAAQKWLISKGAVGGKVQLAGTHFCLDAGSLKSGSPTIIQTCADSPAQKWVYTDDNRIAVKGNGQCLDLTGGVLSNSNPVQTWLCTDNNVNQIWNSHYY